MFEAFRIRHFRYLWAGLTVSNVGAWMQIFALGILVVQIAEREGVPQLAPFYLGLMGLARAVPGLAFTLVAGAVADRVDRRSLMRVTQAIMALNAAALAAAVWLGAANLAIVLVSATVASAAFAFDNPARQSIVPRIVPLPILASAIGLNSASFNGASVIGPLLAGLLYVPIGIGGLLAVNALSYTGVLLALGTMPAVPPARAASHTILASIVEGARYIRANPVLLWIIVTSATIFSTAGPAMALFPAVAGESTYAGMSWLSLLLAAVGLGAFAGALFTMNIGRVRSPGTVLVAAALLNGATLVAFALAREPIVALVFAFLMGLGGTLMAGMGNNILQATTDDAYRGRVMSVWGITFIGVMPVGQLILGALGSLLGIHAALAVGGAVAFAAAVYVTVRVPTLRAWRAPSTRRVATPVQTAAVGQPTFR